MHGLEPNKCQYREEEMGTKSHLQPRNHSQLIANCEREKRFLQWNDNRHNSQPPGQAFCSGVVGPHKAEKCLLTRKTKRMISEIKMVWLVLSSLFDSLESSEFRGCIIWNNCHEVFEIPAHWLHSLGLTNVRCSWHVIRVDDSFPSKQN